jgi:hypothetical protein
MLARGRLPATGLKRSVPLLASFGVEEAERAVHFASEAGTNCQYCAFDALCGKRWEAAE